jgi:hypothetical protein
MVETELFYLVQCVHCDTVYLVEESVADVPMKTLKHGGLARFVSACPRCQAITTTRKEGRLQLTVKKVMKNGEPNPCNVRLGQKLFGKEAIQLPS